MFSSIIHAAEPIHFYSEESLAMSVSQLNFTPGRLRPEHNCCNPLPPSVNLSQTAPFHFRHTGSHPVNPICFIHELL